MHPLIIPTFNNPTYLKRFIEQKSLDNFSSLEIYDNNSSFPPMIQLLQEFEKRDNINVHRLESNYGPHYVLRNPEVYNTLPDIFCLSDPDIEFSSTLPQDFLEQLITISNNFEFGKVGFAIEIPEEEELNIEIYSAPEQVKHLLEFENSFWENHFSFTTQGVPIFATTLDTTFALYNKRYFKPSNRYEALRIGGNFTSKHLGYYEKFKPTKLELEFYSSRSRYSYNRGITNKNGDPLINIKVHEYTTLVEKLESLERDMKRIVTERDDYRNELDSFYRSRSWKIMSIFVEMKKITTKLKFR